jgi:NAD+ synthase (glutamine-hydrolysing)
MNMLIALAQVDSILGDVSKNVAKHVECIRRAKDGGAHIVIFPELSLSGYSVKDIAADVAFRTTAETRVLEPLLRESDETLIIAGGVEESEEFGINNSAFLFEKGNVRSLHRKIYLPTYGMFEEQRYFGSGKSIRAFDCSLGRLGVLICEDLWHLPLPYVLAQDGAQAIIALAASPTRLAGAEATIQNQQVNTEQHKAYARLLSTYVIFCNRVGYEDGVNFWGGSEVIGPDGNVIVQAKLFEEDLVFAEITDNEIRRARRYSRHFLDDRPQLVIDELRRIQRKH